LIPRLTSPFLGRLPAAAAILALCSYRQGLLVPRPTSPFLGRLPAAAAILALCFYR
jgi:hypothetical protein